jgi:hypothetical protein
VGIEVNILSIIEISYFSAKYHNLFDSGLYREILSCSILLAVVKIESKFNSKLFSNCQLTVSNFLKEYYNSHLAIFGGRAGLPPPPLYKYTTNFKKIKFLLL